jgi:ElaB/YqjD/DUF883 family membrane-anchored ribosome-binding protein
MAHKKHRKHEEFYAALQKIRDRADAKEEELIDLIGSVYESVQDTKDKAIEKIHDTANTVNTSVHLHPWHYICGAALIGFLAGLCKRRK